MIVNVFSIVAPIDAYHIVVSSVQVSASYSNYTQIELSTLQPAMEVKNCRSRFIERFVTQKKAKVAEKQINCRLRVWPV